MWIIYGILMVLLVGLAIDHFAFTRFGIHIVPLAKWAGGATSWYNLKVFDLQPSEFMKIIMAVSYTHLDVYKRQKAYWRKFTLTHFF